MKKAQLTNDMGSAHSSTVSVTTYNHESRRESVDATPAHHPIELGAVGPYLHSRGRVPDHDSANSSTSSIEPPRAKISRLQRDAKTRTTTFSAPERSRTWLTDLRHGTCNTYGRLFSIMILGNAVPLFILLMTRFKDGSNLQSALRDLTTLCIHMAAANAMICTLSRSPLVINGLFVVCGAIPRSAPLWLRRRLCKIFHIGGVHSGTGIASCMWMTVFVLLFAFTQPWQRLRLSCIFALAVIVATLLASIIVVAIPTIRRKYHDAFELTHRFAGWLTLVFLWALLLTQAFDEAALGTWPSPGHYLVAFPTFWFLLTSTLAAIWPWTMLRKVPVTPEYLSPHATRLHFAHRSGGWGRGLSLAKHPLKDWHSFAAFTDEFDSPNSKFSCLVSNAGDWTKAVIEERPTKIWVRAVPVCGVGYAMKLFSRVIMVATGSGIGPCLSFIGYKDMPPMRVIWQTRGPLRTYGQRTLDLVRKLDAHPMILDTDQGGRRDVVPIAVDLAETFQAEAVIVISNPVFTKKLVYELETRGIPAYGPIFDS